MLVHKKRLIIVILVSILIISLLILGCISRIPVFMYHSISETEIGGVKSMSLKTSEFEKHLQFYKDSGYETIFIKDLKEFEYNRQKVALTFDDGYEDNYTTMFPLLKKYNMKATIFMPTHFIDTDGYLTTAQLQEMQESGYVDIQSHTVLHTNLSKLPDDDSIIAELKDSQETLEKILNKPINVISYPGGHKNSKVRQLASEFYDKGVLAKSDAPFRLFFDPLQIERLGVYHDTKLDEIKIVCKRLKHTYAKDICLKAARKIKHACVNVFKTNTDNVNQAEN